MRRLLIASSALLALSFPAFAAAPAKVTPAKPAAVKTAAPAPLPIPVYPGSTQVMEITLSEKDMLNWFTNVLPAMAAMSSGNSGLLGAIGKLDLAGLAKALEGLKQIHVVELQLPKSTDNSAQKVTDFYTAQLEKETGWTRVFWKSDDPSTAMAVYSLPNAEGIFVSQVKVTPEGGRLLLGRTAGRVDLAKLIEWAAKNQAQIEAIRNGK